MTASWPRHAWLCLACFVGACSGAGADAPTWTVAKTPLALTAQDWNAAHTDLGQISAVAEDGDSVIVFSDRGVTLLAGGAAAASDTSVTAWRAAGRIAAADAAGYWAIGVDAEGKVYRLRAGMTLENISDRYGLLDDSVLSVAAMAAPYVAFALPKTLAVADGSHVTRYDVMADRHLTADAHRVAAVAANGSLRVLNVDNRELSTIDVADATRSVFFQEQLFVQTPHTLYVMNGHELATVHHAANELRGLVVSGERLWFLQGSELCAVDMDQVACGHADGISASSTLFGSASGDVWLLSDGALTRYGIAAQGDEADWRAGPLSVYARVCSSCHAPGGTAGVDLSTYSRWRDKRDKIYQQVVVSKNMPPDRALADQDRAAIASWTMPH